MTVPVFTVCVPTKRQEKDDVSTARASAVPRMVLVTEKSLLMTANEWVVALLLPM